MMYQDYQLKRGKSYPLDLIFPEDICKCKNNKNITPDTLKRENILKNIVFHEIDKVRQFLNKPKLTDILAKYRLTE